MKQGKLKQVLFFLFCFVLGGVGGFLLGETGINFRLGDLLLVVLYIGISFILHIVIHESGHLVLGLLTGYRFVSFRLFSLCLVSINGKYRLVRHKVPGTLGQCLLEPPAYKENYPFQLYLLGGVLFNGLASIIFLMAYPLAPTFSIAFVFLGLFTGLTNLIPFGFNDGKTLQIAKASKENQKLLYIQLATNAEMTQGSRFSELSKDYFEKIPGVPNETHFNHFQDLLSLGLSLETRNWPDVDTKLNNLWQKRDNLVLPYQLEVEKELLFYLLTQSREDERIEELVSDKKLINYLKLPLISNQRVLVAKTYFYDHQLEEANELIKLALASEDKASNLGEFRVEKELIEWLQSRILENVFETSEK